jgi:hypothetical protein
VPVQWTLSYPVVDEPMQQRCRLHYESLQRDDFVESVRFENPSHLPNVRLLHVTLKPGATQPWNKSLRYLNLQFGAAVMQAATTKQERNFSPPSPFDVDGVRTPVVVFDADAAGLTVEEHQLHLAMRKQREDYKRQVLAEAEFPSTFLPVSPEYSANDTWKLNLPEWCRAGQWVLENNSGAYFEILSVVKSNAVIVSLREWRKEHFSLQNLTSVLTNFSPRSAPRDPETWHRRLMGEDDF